MTEQIKERGTLSKKPIYFLCQYNSFIHYETVPKTERKYRFTKGQPYLIKYDEDIEYFRNHISFVEQPTNIDSEVDVLNEKIADKVQEAIEEDAKTPQDSSAPECEDVPSTAEKSQESAEELVEKTDLPPIKADYTKTELRKMNKSEQIKLIQEYKDHQLSNDKVPVRENGRIELILKLQGNK